MGQFLDKGILNFRDDPLDIVIARQDNELVPFGQEVSEFFKEYLVAGYNTVEFPACVRWTRPKTKPVMPEGGVCPKAKKAMLQSNAFAVKTFSRGHVLDLKEVNQITRDDEPDTVLLLLSDLHLLGEEFGKGVVEPEVLEG
jgi:hypothetical protein